MSGSGSARGKKTHRDGADGETPRNGGGAAAAEWRWRQALITFFPMLIAVLSLLTSIYNGYLNNKFVTLIQGNLSRAEYMRTCRDVIDAYFQVKYRTSVVAREAAAGGAVPPAAAGTTDAPALPRQAAGAASQSTVEAGNAVARFGALATYLANMRDEKTRASYTELYWKLDELAAKAATSSAKEREATLSEADKIFAPLNDDCVHHAGSHP